MEDNKDQYNISKFNPYPTEDELKKLYRSIIRTSIRGLDLPAEDTKRLESHIQQILIDEITKIKQLHFQNSITKELSSQSENKNAIKFSLEGLDLPAEDTERLESHIQQILIDEITTKGKTLGEIYLCAGFLQSPPDLRCSYEVPPITRPSPPLNPFQLGLWAKEDTVIIKFYDTSVSSPQGLRPTEMEVAVNIERGMWAKEIVAWDNSIGVTNWCNNGNNPLHSRRNWMRIHKPGTTPSGPGVTSADTIVLMKPKFLGSWHYMYSFNDPYFWDRWGGKIMIFNWIHDTYGNGSCANPWLFYE